MFGYKTYRFSLSVDRDSLLAIYQGAIKKIRVRTDRGMILELDANHLRQFTTNDGVRGIFELTTTQENKFVKITKIS